MTRQSHAAQDRRVQRIIEHVLEESGYDTENFQAGIARFGIRLVPGALAAKDHRTVKVLNRWYWLMVDAAADQAYDKVNLDMMTWLEHQRVEPEEKESWCGTRACAGGLALVAGLFPGFKATFNRDGGLTVPDFDEVRDSLGMLSDDWESITGTGIRADRRTTAKAVAEEIANVMKETYGVKPMALPRAKRPWLGTHAAFEPRRRTPAARRVAKRAAKRTRRRA